MSTYKDSILKEIEEIPEDKKLRFYRIIHLLAQELMFGSKQGGERGSLKGIWRGSHIEESLFDEAEKSLFPYEKSMR
jgi:hypothetical protein